MMQPCSVWRRRRSGLSVAMIIAVNGSASWLMSEDCMSVFVHLRTSCIIFLWQGPESRKILAPLVWTCPTQPDIESLKWFRFTIGRIGGPEGIPVVVSRTGYTGELGYEIWCHPRQASAVWDAIWKAGKPKGMVPLGLEALDWLRIEAGLAFANYEFCPETDPFEAGIGFAVPAAKVEDYVGREALIRRRENPRQSLVGLESHMNDRLDHGDPVYSGRARVGVVTSACSSPVLEKTLRSHVSMYRWRKSERNWKLENLTGFKREYR